MSGIIDTLITDRTQADVDRARYLNGLWDARAGRWMGTSEEWAEWTAGPRGAYGFADMNRVTQAVAYLTGQLEELGYSVAVGEVIPAYNIRVSADPAGGGIASGGGTFYRGDEVSVSAQPGEKYDFVGWMENGEFVSVDAAYTFTVDRSRSLVAVFALKQFRVDVGVEPDGSGEASGAGVYDIDTEVTVAASAGEGYVFARWAENGETVAEGPEYTFTLDRDRVLKAVMTKLHVISVSANDDDGGTVTGSGTFLDGQTVTVAAVAGEGYEFAGWQEDGRTVSEEAVYSFPAVADRELVAVFVRTHVITLLADPAGWGTAAGGGTYREGEQVTVTATPGSDWRFVAWVEDGERVSASRAYTFTVTGDRALIAVFEEVPVYTVTVTIDPAGSGTVTGAGQYQEGESVTVRATAADGMALSKWQVNGQDVGTGASYTFTVTEDAEVVAVFEKYSRLPAGYTELQYITSSQNYTYFNSGINYSTIGKLQMKVSHVTGGSSSSGKYYCGLYAVSYNGTSGRRATLWGLYANSSNAVIAAYNTATSTTTTAPGVSGYIVQSGAVSSTATYEMEIDIQNQTASCNGNTVAITVSPYALDLPVYILSRGVMNYPASASPVQSSAMNVYCRFYYCKIWNTSGTLVRDFVPCKDPSGNVGAYDTVSKSFFDSYGSGKFTAGPAV